MLEAAYLLAIGKSPIASSDREQVNWNVEQKGGHSQVQGVAREGDLTVKAQIDFEIIPRPAPDVGPAITTTLRKSLRLNGSPSTASEFVGSVNVVLFSADDLTLVLGSPSGRRRYLDILISQTDPIYLKTLQRYQRVVRNRNQLLRRIRDHKASDNEMVFWEERLIFEGAVILDRRRRAVDAIAAEATDAHSRLTSHREALSVVYRPRLTAESDQSENEVPQSTKDAEQVLLSALAAVRKREVAQGISIVGPHRDDLQILLGGKQASLFASRGQARTIALALKLAESEHLAHLSGRQPILALDDVLSELDRERRRLVIEATGGYDQVLLTTTDFDLVDKTQISGAHKFKVCSGKVYPLK